MDRQNRPGWNRFVVNGVTWNVPARYTNLMPIGRGGYGSVCSATDTVHNRTVAIKKLFRSFATSTDAKRAYREFKLLQHVNHDNQVGLLDIFTDAEAPEQLQDIYFCTHHMSTDLSQVIESQQLGEEQIKFLIYQILRGLKYLHSANIIHRDLKPCNMIVNENCDLKIIDFGLARPERDGQMTGYVATRWWRAPEIMLNWMRYDKAVDMWSVGCILAEMYLRRPLFPGRDQFDQLNIMMRVAGFPQERFLARLESDVRGYLEMGEKPERVDFNVHFNEIPSESARDLISKMLQLDPEDRITCEQALEHPYLSAYHDPDDEPNGPRFQDQFEDQEHSVERWREILFQEIQAFVEPPYTGDV